MSIEMSFASHTIRLSSSETLGEMMDELSSSTAGTVMLGMEEESLVGFHLMHIDLDPGNHGGRSLGIGICTSGSGIPPQVLLRPERELLIIGLNSEIVGVDIRRADASFRVTCSGPFYAFYGLACDDAILGFYELGVVSFTDDGEEIWRFDQGDILTSWTVERQELRLTFMDGGTHCVNIQSGNVSA